MDITKCAETVHLEVRTGTSSSSSGKEEEWQHVGPISLLHQKDDNSQEVPVATTETPSTGNGTRPKQLPKAAKQFLLGDTPRQERKQVYLYRHATQNGSGSSSATRAAPNTNLLVLLHGAGDSHVPFDKLGQTMALPQTATLAWNARNHVTLPLGLGYTWFHELNYQTGEPLPLESNIRIESLRDATRKMVELLKLLLEGWVAERIFLLGYGAGATLAMSACQEWCQENRPALGGAICVAGGVRTGVSAVTTPSSIDKNPATPILILVGEHNPTFSPSMANQAKRAYTCGGDNVVQVHVEPNKGQGMISTRNEMQTVMEFLSQRLVRVSTSFPGTKIGNAPPS